MQRRHLDDDAADRDGFQNGIGIEFSGTAHVDENVEQLRPRFGRSKLVRGRPAWIATRIAEPCLNRELVDFNHDAVDFVAELVATLFPSAAKGNDFVDRRAARRFGVDGESKRRQGFEQRELRRRFVAVEGTDGVGEKRQPSLARHARVFLTQTAGRRIARRREQR